MVVKIRGFPKLGVPFLGGPYNKDCNVLGSILGSPYNGKLPLWSLCGSLVEYGTEDLGYPKRDHNFDNHPYLPSRTLLVGVIMRSLLGSLEGRWRVEAFMCADVTRCVMSYIMILKVVSSLSTGEMVVSLNSGTPI